MRYFIILLALVVAITGSCHREPEKNLIVRLQGKEQVHSLGQLKYLVPAESIKVDDHYLKRKITYRVFRMVKLLSVFSAAAGDYDEVIFRCADGYLAHVSRADIEAGKLDSFYLAYGEGGDKFKSLIPQGKAEISPEPFYAVATDENGFSTLSWPYEIVAIEFVNFRQMFPGLYFAGLEKNPEVKQGFDLFRKECLKCHSLNLQGGDIGPELNVPQNITEYRDAVTLIQFIRNASAFRAKSKMPAFPHLDPKNISDILSYLRAMRLHKQGVKGAEPP